MATSPSVGAPQQTPAIGPSGSTRIPFRRATTERVSRLTPENGITLSDSSQPIQRTIEGSGFIYGITLRVRATAATNVATVAYNEDAPWNALSAVSLEDANAQMINVTGYDLYLANLINRQYAVRFADQSTDSKVYDLEDGSGGSAGSFGFFLRVPVGTNRRDLRGIQGNQDRAQKYDLRTDVASLAAVYATAPTNAPTVTIEKFYENFSVPLSSSPTGAPNQQLPSDFGTVHYTTGSNAEASPAPGPISHFLRRVGNTVRWLALTFRSDGSRADAETNFPTAILFKVGEDVIFRETWAYRKFVMFERFGFDLPDGVLVYDRHSDFVAAAGYEIGDDYIHSQSLVNAEFEITYPDAFGNSGNSLRILTDDLQYVQPHAGTAVSA